MTDLTPSLSIVVVNWNTRDLLANCLASARRDVSTFQRLNVETFVVDNASSDGSAPMVRERFPWVRLIENGKNVGFASASNQGIAQAGGRHVLLLNADTEVAPGALEELHAFMDAHPQAGAAGARLLNPDGTLQPSCYPMLSPGREFWRLLFLEHIWPQATYPMHRWDSTIPRRVEVIKGACLVLRRAAVEQVGLLDESYFMYTEEVDLCYRLAQAGWDLWYVPQAQVIHFGEASSRQAAEAMYLQLYRSKVHFYRKFGGEPRARRFVRLLRLAYWPRWAFAALGGCFSPALAERAKTCRRMLTSLSQTGG
jgi:N-acetylglucosaminyl-diphospho-decaprenol L-rhamnosyltransferase